MAARVTAEEVLIIMDNVTLSDPIVNSYILGASTLVDDVLGASTLGDDLLKEIERWLSAHLIAVTRERTAKKEGAGGAFVEYTGEWGTSLSSTSYGQMATTLDTTGGLKSLDKKQASLTAIAQYEK